MLSTKRTLPLSSVITSDDVRVPSPKKRTPFNSAPSVPVPHARRYNLAESDLTAMGYRVLNHPYDELLTLIPKDGREQEHVERCVAEMKKTPDWLPGLVTVTSVPAPSCATDVEAGTTPLAAPGYEFSVPPAVAPVPEASAAVLAAKATSDPAVPSSK